MSPQPAAAPQQKAPDRHKALLDRVLGKDADKRTSVEKQVARALRLENERAATMKQIAANREYLRLMEENEELTDEEADWLEDFYPQKEKGSARTDDEIERTRKAKAAARNYGK